MCASPLSAAPQRSVWVTGVGLCTPLGDREQTWSRLLAGESGVRSIADRFGWGGRVGVGGWIELPAADASAFPARTHALAHRAATEAILDAGLSEEDRSTLAFVAGNNCAEYTRDEKTALVRRALRGELGRSGESETVPEMGLAWVAHALGLGGATPTLATNCVAGAQAVYLGASWIGAGLCDRVLAGGVDCAVTEFMTSRFLALQALAQPASLASSRPFDRDRHGFVVGDGAGFVVLEAADRVRPDVRPYGRICGWGLSNDAYHLTRGAPDLEAKCAAVLAALEMADVSPRDVVAVNTHGTSTQDNDGKEIGALRSLLGAHLDRALITANKSALGHCLAGAGAIELGITFLMLRDGVAPPILNLENVDDTCRAESFVRSATRFTPGPCLKTTFAFGGLNACGVVAPV